MSYFSKQALADGYIREYYSVFGRYWIASPRCRLVITLLPAKSAIVRETFKIRCRLRPEKLYCFIAPFNTSCSWSFNRQCSFSSNKVISLFVLLRPKRRRWTSRAASTLVFTPAEFSAGSVPTIFSYGRRGTSTCKSIRSSSGPEIFFWYLKICPGLHKHFFEASPK